MFAKWKTQRLGAVDLSKKGSLDAPIATVVDFINSLDDFFTTSSCSGRIVLFSEIGSTTGGPVKKGCEWHLVSHDPVELEQLTTALTDKTGNIVLKFEAFILHVQCKHLENAQLVHKAAVASGHRNSGITVGKNGKSGVIMADILQVPYCGCQKHPQLRSSALKDETMFVNGPYLEFLRRTANAKMKENFSRIERFEKCFKELVSTTKQSNCGPDVMNKHNPTRKLEKKPCKATQTDMQTVQPDSSKKSDEYSRTEPMLESFDWPEEVT
ncbi:putative tRNA wybutosine-synthesizing protein 3-like isoform X1 [Apostichopus japonicus]|uniref:tRNA wybutosine-synthesizing protein 3 homolog n=1 Tax=Stichopus japonicus TaxID=307972 RepID=A0A2G8LPD3_STIJA|nr:putative tRNA wybutosine-synthesizing protein 3-like isoform X1 [Apostichopus japonicus]